MAVDGYGPKAFILAPDGEFSAFDPENDQIWSLSLDASDTSPFHLDTTYHLRARSMRVYPNIIVGHHRFTKPDDFTLRPTVTRYTPSTLHIKYAFTNDVSIQFTCFIPEPGVLAGRIEIHHAGGEPIDIDCELAAILNPMGKGSPTHPEKINGNQILSGHTDHLYPVLFMSGGPVATSNPFPALCSSLHLDPGQREERHWALASKTSHEASLKTARELATPAWCQALQIQEKAHDRQTLYIKTGNPDWDTAFLLSQVNALTHLVNLDKEDHQVAFIATRHPDQPLPSHLQSAEMHDLTLLDTLHLAQVLLPTHADHLTRLAESFVNQVDDQGGLPSRIHRGISGGAVNECPLLANLCLALFEFNDDPGFLGKALPEFKRFFDSGWLADADLDRGFLPYWETPAQLQLETGLFNFDTWEETGNGVDIRTAQSPALAAMLHREAIAMGKIARILGDRSARARYGKILKRLHEIMRSLWNDERNIFSYLDRQSHLSPPRELYYPGRIQTTLKIHKRFTQPQRLHLKLIASPRHNRACVVRIDGRNADGEKIVEQFQSPDLRWAAGHAHLTTHQLFTLLDSVAFKGFNKDDRFLIETADYSQTDISCLLPIGSGGLHKDQMASILETHLDWQDPDLASGIPETWRCFHPLPEGLRKQVNIQWNTLIIEGLVREGYAQEAMELFTNLMSTIIHGLKDYNGFYPAYDIERGIPQGQANAIQGLAPLGLCLQIAGIKIISPDRVAIWGSNPFPWPIEARWQGLWVRRDDAQTEIIFPQGTHYQSQATKPLVVTSGRGQVL